MPEDAALLFLDCAALLLAARLLRLQDALRSGLFAVLVATAVWGGMGSFAGDQSVVIFTGAISGASPTQLR